MNENASLFGNSQLQIELRPHTAVEAVAALQETPRPYKTRRREQPTGRRREHNVRSEE